MRAGDRRTLGGLLLLALCVGLAAWLLGTSDERDAGRAGVGAATSEPGATSAAVPAVDEKAAAPQSLASDAATVAPPEPDAPPGEALRFTGRVVDEAGEPIADALVLHWPSKPVREATGQPGNPEWKDVAWETLPATHTDAQGRFLLESRDLAPERSASIGLDGNWYFTGDEPGELWPVLLVEHEGFGLEEVRLGTSREGAADAGVIVLRRGVVLSGRLVDPHGEGVADVGLWLRPLGGPTSGAVGLDNLQRQRLRASTDRDGRFRLEHVPFAPWYVGGEPAGFAPFDLKVRPEQPGLLDLGDIALDPGQALAGRVLDDHGAPLAGAEVMVRMMLPIGGSRGPDRSAAAWGSGIDASGRIFEPRVRTEADGSFVLQGLWSEVDSFRVMARAPGFDPDAADEVKAGTQDVELALQPEATWLLQVADAVDQRPVAGVALRAFRPIENSDDKMGDITPVHDEDGNWLLHGAGRWRTELLVSAPGHATTRFTLDGLGAGESRQQLLLLPRELGLDGRVTDDAGMPLPGATVQLEQDAEYWVSEPHFATSGAEGRFHFGQLAPGTWSVKAAAPAHVDLRRAPDLVLTAGAAAPPLEIVLPKGGRIEGEVREVGGAPVPRASVEARSKDPAALAEIGRTGDETAPRRLPESLDAQALADPDGRFAFDGLPSGTWELRGDRGAVATVQVSARSTVQAVLVQRAAGRVEGRVTAGGVPQAGVLVELGNPYTLGTYWIAYVATHTDASGHYELQRDGDGDFAVLARDGTEQSRPVMIKLAPEALVHADLAFSSGRVAGRVTLAGEGTPLRDVSIELKQTLDATGNQVLRRFASTDADGHFAFERLPAGTWSVTATSELLIPPAIPDQKVQDDAPTPELDLVMTRGGALEIVLADPGPWGRVVRASLRPLASQHLVETGFLPDMHGTLSPVEPGDFTLELSRHDGKDWVLMHSERITITAGQTLRLRIAD